MHCENVFDILTQGPFPQGQHSDEAVERHLASCHECRHLAETLQPAVQLLHECLDPRDHDACGSSSGDDGLPTYRGRFAGGQTPPSLSLPQQIDRAMRLAGSPPSARPSSPHRLPSRSLELSERSAEAAHTASGTIHLRRTSRSWPSCQTLLVVAVLCLVIVLLRGSVATSFRDTPTPDQPQSAADWIRLASIDLQPACLAASERDGNPIASAVPKPADQAVVEPIADFTMASPAKLVCCSQCHQYGGTAPVSRLAAIVKTCGACH